MMKTNGNKITSLRELVGTVLTAAAGTGRRSMQGALRGAAWVPGPVMPPMIPVRPVAAMCARFGIRERSVLTRTGHLRLRFLAAPVSCTFLLLGSTLSIHNIYQGRHLGLEVAAAKQISDPVKLADAREEVERRLVASQKRMQRYARRDGFIDEAGKDEENKNIVMASFAPAMIDPQPKTSTVEIGKGDTLAGVLQHAGVQADDAYNAVKELQKSYDPRAIRPGQKIRLHFDPGGQGKGYDFSGLEVAVDTLKTVKLNKTTAGDFEAKTFQKKVSTHTYVDRATIDVSLYGSALKAGIPRGVIDQAIRVYSWDVDFQRDIRQGDSIEVMYEQQETPEGERVKTGNLLYARINVGGRSIPIYRYEGPDGFVEYYDAKGASLRKALLKTPIDGARISSGFGVRHHPVLGYTKMHKGIDFAASRGTPIYAAGNGIVERAGRFSSYGNYIRIRHNSSYKTAYGHMQRVANGIHAGVRVKQGQVIGYVGATGRATGPHLHYEVIMNGTQVNPKKVKVAQGDSLGAKQLAAYKSYVRKMDQKFQALAGGAKLASLDAKLIDLPR
jgi:murein DD-endopeptidase MepM/ murein hydrolase activator NlpD